MKKIMQNKHIKPKEFPAMICAIPDLENLIEHDDTYELKFASMYCKSKSILVAEMIKLKDSINRKIWNSMWITDEDLLEEAINDMLGRKLNGKKFEDLYLHSMNFFKYTEHNLARAYIDSTFDKSERKSKWKLVKDYLNSLGKKLEQDGYSGDDEDDWTTICLVFDNDTLSDKYTDALSDGSVLRVVSLLINIGDVVIVLDLCISGTSRMDEPNHLEYVHNAMCELAVHMKMR